MGNLQKPWNGWYHAMGHTYGTWLPGDPRGFRVRKHKEHVDGDYKRPPPSGVYEKLHEHSKSIMTDEPVKLEAEYRVPVLELLVKVLIRHRVEVVVASLDSVHFHVLMRCEDQRADHWVGLAKKESAFRAGEEFPELAGGIWARGGKNQPIKDRKHQLNVVRYILKHRKEGAVVWFKGEFLK